MNFNVTRRIVTNSSASGMTSPGALPLRVTGDVAKDSRQVMSSSPSPSPDDEALARTLYIVGPGSIIISLFVIGVVTIKLKAKKRTEEQRTHAPPVRSVAINVDLADPPPCYVDVMKNLAIYKKPVTNQPQRDPSLPTYAEAITVLANQHSQCRHDTRAMVEIISSTSLQRSTDQEQEHNT